MVLLGLLVVGTASAADFLTFDSPTYYGTMPDIRTPVSFTQNVDATTIEATQVACGVAGISTTQNWYLRRFFLTPDHDITTPLCVQSVVFGVQQLQMADGSEPPPYDIVVKVFQLGTAAPFTFGAMGVPIGTATVTITSADIGQLLTATILPGNIPINPATHDVVVAIDAPDGSLIGAGLQFRPGANDNGNLWPAYIAAVDCGIPDPISVDDIGFPTSQTIFVVNGEDNCGQPPDPTETTSWGQVKALYR
jgi:hypothetical protein